MLRKIGTRIATHAEYDTEYLFLPCTVGGELVGGIRAAMEGSNVKVKYKNSTGAWSRSHGLFPYDTSVNVMLENENVFGQKVMVLTEGPRDSLYLMERGIPAVSILGTQSWSIEKRDLLLDMDADFILICMDGDVAGRKAEKKVYASLKELASCKKMNITMFNVTEGKELDPASSPDWLIDKIKKRLMKK
jgi:DNA primase